MRALNLSRNICVLLLVLNVAEVDGYTAKSSIKPIFCILKEINYIGMFLISSC